MRPSTCWPIALCALAFALLASTTPLHAQRGGVELALAGDLASDIARANERGIPREPLLDKIREGELKQASPARIRAAVGALAERLEKAQRALAPASTAELVAGADALAAGVPPAALRRVREAAPGRPITVPLGVLAQLVASGVPVARATERIVSLVQRNVAAAQLVALGASVESDMRAGIAAADALDLRLRGLGVPGLSTNVSADAVPTAVSPAGPRPASPGTTTTQGGTTTTRTGRPRP